MSRYVSVRGWIESSHDLADVIFATITTTVVASEEVRVRQSLYANGWVFPKNNRWWSYYCFFGADVRNDDMEIIRNWLREIAKIKSHDAEFVDFVKGVFHLEDEEGEDKQIWTLSEGSLVEIR